MEQNNCPTQPLRPKDLTLMVLQEGVNENNCLVIFDTLKYWVFNDPHIYEDEYFELMLLTLTNLKDDLSLMSVLIQTLYFNYLSIQLYGDGITKNTNHQQNDEEQNFTVEWDSTNYNPDYYDPSDNYDGKVWKVYKEHVNNADEQVTITFRINDVTKERINISKHSVPSKDFELDAENIFADFLSNDLEESIIGEDAI